MSEITVSQYATRKIRSLQRRILALREQLATERAEKEESWQRCRETILESTRLSHELERLQKFQPTIENLKEECEIDQVQSGDALYARLLAAMKQLQSDLGGTVSSMHYAEGGGRISQHNLNNERTRLMGWYPKTVLSRIVKEVEALAARETADETELPPPVEEAPKDRVCRLCGQSLLGRFVADSDKGVHRSCLDMVKRAHLALDITTLRNLVDGTLGIFVHPSWNRAALANIVTALADKLPEEDANDERNLNQKRKQANERNEANSQK